MNGAKYYRNGFVCEVLTALDWCFFHRVEEHYLTLCRFVSSLPVKTQPFGNCHSICMAIAQVESELRVEHGYFLGLSEGEAENTLKLEFKHHSWLVTPDGNIIDPYPVCIATKGIIMVCAVGSESCWGGNMYQPNTNVRIGIESERIWLRRAEVLRRILCGRKLSEHGKHR